MLQIKLEGHNLSSLHIWEQGIELRNICFKVSLDKTRPGGFREGMV